MRFLRLRTWQMGIKSLTLHPLRSMLTVLGIFIGVASVIWLLAIGEGISRKAQEQIEDLGVTNIIVRSVLPAEDTLSDTTFYVKYGVLRSDYDALMATIPGIRRALRIREAKREVYCGDVLLEGHVVACTPEYADVMHLELARGRFLSDLDIDNVNSVCVLADSTAKAFFPLEDPIGKTIRVRQVPYQVVGVMEARAPMAGIGSSIAAQDFVNDIYIPITAFWRRIGDQVLFIRAGSRTGEEVQLSQITFQVDSADEVIRTAEAIKRVMAQRHPKEDYAVVTPLELLEQARTTRLMFMVFMGLIAAISLIVGGIGIMNIMLATVTERTREIGIRRALGARRADVTRQFLVETVVLSVLGGVLGIAGGFTCPLAVNGMRQRMDAFFPQAMASLPEAVREVSPEIVPWSIPLAFGISVVVGVVFGMYPAARAALMDPIEALRHE